MVKGKEFAMVEDFVYTVGDPFGFKNVGIGKFGAEADVVLEVEDDAEVVEEFQQVVLSLAVGDIGLGADLLIVVTREEVLGALFELFFDGEPGLGQGLVEVGKLAEFLDEGGLEGVDALVIFAGGLEDGVEVGVFEL